MKRGPLIIEGVRYCRACVAKVGGVAEAFNQPGIFNLCSGIRHLNKDKRHLRTLCGLDTKNGCWQEPARLMARREARWHREWEREYEARPRSGAGSQ